MTPRCGTCALWGDDKDAKQTYRKCMAIQHIEPHYDDETIVVLNGDEYQRPIVPYTASAGVMDGSGYYAALKTRDDFGCTLHMGAPATPIPRPHSHVPPTT